MQRCHLHNGCSGVPSSVRPNLWTLRSPPAAAPRAAQQQVVRRRRSCAATTVAAVAPQGGAPPASSSAATAQAPKSKAAQQQQQQQQKGPAEFRYLELNLPPPANTKVTSARLAKSSVRPSDGPPGRLPEFALIGRSNVGKSSMINSMTNAQKLARVSKEPGMTKLINHYLVNDSWYLVDLPGYGFAKTASKASRTEWLDFTKDYFIQRDSLAHVLLLIDSSLPPQMVDVECANWLVECEVPFAIVFTKLDNRKKEGPSPQQNISAFKAMLSKDFERLPWCFETSSRTGAGRTELLGYLSSVRQMHEAAGGA